MALDIISISGVPITPLFNADSNSEFYLKYRGALFLHYILSSLQDNLALIFPFLNLG